MNDFQVKFTNKAEYDLARILSYIAQGSIEKAENFVDKLFTKMTDTLSIMPTAGVLFGQRKGYNVYTFVLHKSYTAFYIILEDEKKFWTELKRQGVYRYPSNKQQ